QESKLSYRLFLLLLQRLLIKKMSRKNHSEKNLLTPCSLYNCDLTFCRYCPVRIKKHQASLHTNVCLKIQNGISERKNKLMAAEKKRER
ncbi:MAG: hypothetical protein ACK50A_02480, partial [Sphingobacteriaceae bacterium]